MQVSVLLIKTLLVFGLHELAGSGKGQVEFSDARRSVRPTAVTQAFLQRADKLLRNDRHIRSKKQLAAEPSVFHSLSRLIKHLMRELKIPFQISVLSAEINYIFFTRLFEDISRFQLPNGLRRVSTADRLLGLRVRIPPGAWMFVCCKCCVLSGRGLCDGPITRPEESYRLWCVLLCDLENRQNEAAG